MRRRTVEERAVAASPRSVRAEASTRTEVAARRRRDARPGGRPRSALCRGGVGESQRASAVRVVPPTSVLAGQDLQKQLEATIGATLQSEPGVAMRAFGPGPARPVIRGLDGDRVAVLQDGQRVGDLSSQSGDHGVTLNPSSATRIEVIRGPATLLYGANAIGGLVNTITDQIPTAPVVRPTGEFIFDLGSNAGEAGGAGDVHFGNGRFAMHVAGGGRRNGDFSTPEGEVENSQSRSSVFNVGGSWTGVKRYVGASYGFDGSKYGIPIVEEADQPEPRASRLYDSGRRHGAGGRDSFVSGDLGIRRYQHDELVGDEVGTHFDNDTEDAELMLSHRPFRRLSGHRRRSFLNRAFNAIGEEALSPPIDQRGGALFLYERTDLGRMSRCSSAALIERHSTPTATPCRIATSRRYRSVGLLLRPAAAKDDVVIAMSLARAARNPRWRSVLLWSSSRQLRVRDWEPFAEVRGRTRIRPVAAHARTACGAKSRCSRTASTISSFAIRSPRRNSRRVRRSFTIDSASTETRKE